MAPRFKVRILATSKILKNISIISIVLLSFFLVLFSKSDLFLINSIKNISSTIINPITSIISSPIRIITNLTNEYDQFKNLKFENKILQEEIIRLKKWQTLAIQNSRENRVLKKLLKATDNDLKLIKTASLVNRNDLLFSKLININAGYENDIRKNMTAINERGLVGKVIETSSSTSRILLLTDPNLSISVKTISNGVFSLISGAGDNKFLVSSFIKNDKLPKIGDIVVTSGTAQVFPVDLLVGKIAKIEKDRFYVLPFVNFNNIDYVQIVTSK
jgi:rod shape-determining protein MreC